MHTFQRLVFRPLSLWGFIIGALIIGPFGAQTAHARSVFARPMTQASLVIIANVEPRGWSANGKQELLQVDKPKTIFSAPGIADPAGPGGIWILKNLRGSEGETILFSQQRQLLALQPVLVAEAQKSGFEIPKGGSLYKLCTGEWSSVPTDFVKYKDYLAPLSKAFGISDETGLTTLATDLTSWRSQPNSEAQIAALLTLYKAKSTPASSGYRDVIPTILGIVLVGDFAAQQDGGIDAMIYHIDQPGNWARDFYKRKQVLRLLKVLNDHTQVPLYTDTLPTILRQLSAEVVNKGASYTLVEGWNAGPGKRWIGREPDAE